MKRPIVLIADDDQVFCELMDSVIAAAGYEVHTANSLSECINCLQERRIDILFQDLCFPALSDGYEALDYAHETHPDTTVIMISGEGHIPDAVRALKCGAADFIEKPIHPEHIMAKIMAKEGQLDLEESNKGLAVMSLDKGRQYIIYSTASGQTAADGGSAGLSPFTDAFVRHAGTPGLTIDQMMHMVNADVRQSTDGKQIPFTYHSMDQPYYLARADDSVPLSTTSGKPVYTPPSAQHDMVYVEGGSFMMGSNGYYDDETPVHKVTVSSFWIGKYEVTQAEWKEVMGSNPSYWKGDRLPVEKVSWYAAIKYCNLRSLAEGLTPCYSISGITSPSNWGPVPTENRNSTWDAVVCDFNANGYRLPTEAEWEYAARGGVRSIGYDYSGSNNLGSVAWYTDNSDSKTHAVGTKDPNELGIYDMSGNVWEWCWDWKANYSSSPQDNPTGPNKGSYRLLRGGSWYGSATYCRVAYRDYDNPYVGYFYYVGFRLCRTAK